MDYHFAAEWYYELGETSGRNRSTLIAELLLNSLDYAGASKFIFGS